MLMKYFFAIVVLSSSLSQIALADCEPIYRQLSGSLTDTASQARWSSTVGTLVFLKAVLDRRHYSQVLALIIDAKRGQGSYLLALTDKMNNSDELKDKHIQLNTAEVAKIIKDLNDRDSLCTNDVELLYPSDVLAVAIQEELADFADQQYRKTHPDAAPGKNLWNTIFSW